MVAEWANLRSARRIYCALSEAGIDLEPLADALVRSLLELDPQTEALEHLGPGVATYQRFMVAAWALGEPLACDIVRGIHPKPPAQYTERLPGYLFNRAKSPTDRAPRTRPNARSHAPGRPGE